jgi:hypothetical protein
MNATDQTSNSVPARYIRIPPSGTNCPWTALSHAGFYNLLTRAGPEIKTVSLKRPGEKRGTRLVFLPSVMAYLNSLPSQMDGGAVASAPAPAPQASAPVPAEPFAMAGS